MRDSMHPTKKRNLGQTIILGIGFTMLLFISMASVWLVMRTRGESELLQKSIRIENAVTQLGTSLRRAESAQRGFLLSENESYLDLFESGIELSAQGARALDDEVLESEEDRVAVARLEELAMQKIAELRQTVRLQREGARDRALELVRSNLGENLMREVSQIVETTRVRLRGRAAGRAVKGQQSTLALLVVTLSSTATIFVLAFLSTRMSRRATAEIESARVALAEVNAHLEKRVVERTADLQDANNEIQSFAYIVSHDLRSPLVNIMGFTSELESLRTDAFARLDAALGPEDAARKQLATDFAEAFAFIKTSTSKMDRLINAILKLARAGRRKLVPARIDVAALAESIAATLHHQLLERGATIEVRPLPTIESDQLALEQIFTNLLDNAVKYLRPGVVGTIEVAGKESATDVVYEVRDNGRGIDAGDLGRVFELFRRSGKQDQTGEGIGLAHVRSLVRRLGGTIGIESELGRGTTFRITLPLRIAEDDAASAP